MFLRKRARRRGCWLAEDDEGSAVRVERERNEGSSVGDGIGGSFDLASVGMPDLWRVTGEAEVSGYVLGAIVAVVNEVDIGSRELAVDEKKFGIRLPLFVVEVWRDV